MIGHPKKLFDNQQQYFCLGNDDLKILKDINSKNKSNIIKTGSPRVDLWKSIF